MRIKSKAKLARGTLDDPTVILDYIPDYWTELQEALNDPAYEDEQDAIRNYFNSLDEDDDDLGDVLFGDDPEAFTERISLLGENVKVIFAQAIIDEEIIDKEDLER